LRSALGRWEREGIRPRRMVGDRDNDQVVRTKVAGFCGQFGAEDAVPVGHSDRTVGPAGGASNRGSDDLDGGEVYAFADRR